MCRWISPYRCRQSSRLSNCGHATPPGTNKTLLQLVAGQAGEQDTAEKVRALEEKLREREAELAEERRLNRRLTAKLLLEGNAEEGSGQNTGNEAASGQ